MRSMPRRDTLGAITRRELLGTCSAAAASSALLFPATLVQADPNAAAKPLRVLVIGAHPGDPEAGCGGTMARFANLGHDVSALYLTRGEAGVSGKSHPEAAEIRSAEAVAACKILGARPIFAGQIDAATEVNPARSKEFTRQVAAERPDVVFTQWPVDTHPDHRACASLTIGVWIALGKQFALYFYEVDLGSDTQCFSPTVYIDVTDVESMKRDARVAHRSQNPSGFYNRDHLPMMRFRGMESGCQFAEAFVLHPQSPTHSLSRF